MKIVIIGNGIAGITAARNIRKLSSHEITVISEESPYFFSRTALMYVYMGHLKFEHTQPFENFFWKKNQINLIQKRVEKVDFTKKIIYCSDNAPSLTYDVLILAVGSKYNKFGWKGQDLEGVQGLYHRQDLELMEKNSQNIQHAVIVGGGLIGIEMVEMLLSRNISVTFLVRESSFWNLVLPENEAQLVGRHIREHHVDLRLATELDEILGDEKGRVKGVITKNGEKIDCQIVGLTVGVSPNVDFLKNSGLEIKRGIVVNDFLQTNFPDVYAVGDCVELQNPQPFRRPIEQVWYTGRMMGETVAKTICGNPTPYKPGIWFNSAKFFDIEYQIYGLSWNQIKDLGGCTFYWEHPKGKHSIRLNYSSKGHIVGIKTFGIRFRHEICEQWIKEKKSIDFVIEHLPLANFDPEFFEQFEPDILRNYNVQTGKNLTSKAKKGIVVT